MQTLRIEGTFVHLGDLYLFESEKTNIQAAAYSTPMHASKLAVEKPLNPT